MANKTTVRALFKAIRHGDLELVSSMVANDPALVNSRAMSPPKKDDGQSPLQVALKTGQTAIANVLIDCGADVNFMETASVNEWRAPALHDAIRGVVAWARFPHSGVRALLRGPLRRPSAHARAWSRRNGGRLLRQHLPGPGCDGRQHEVGHGAGVGGSDGPGLQTPHRGPRGPWGRSRPRRTDTVYPRWTLPRTRPSGSASRSSAKESPHRPQAARPQACRAASPARLRVGGRTDARATSR